MGAEGVGLAHGIDHFPQQIGVGELFDAFVRMALPILPLEAFDFRREDFLEAFVDLARMLQCIAVDQQGRGAIERTAGVQVEVRKQRQTTRHDDGVAFFIGPLVTSDLLENLPGHGGVAAHDDENRRRSEHVGSELSLLAQAPLIFLVVGVKLLQCRAHHARQMGGRFTFVYARILARLALPFLGEFSFAVFVEVLQNRLVDLLAAVVDGEKGNLHQAGFDRFDQAEIAHGPGKQGIRGVTGAGQVIGRRRQIVDGPQLEALGDGPEPRKPDGSPLVFGF